MPRSAAEVQAQADAAAAGIAGDQGGHVIGHRFILFSSVTRKRREEELPSGYLEARDIFVFQR